MDVKFLVLEGVDLQEPEFPLRGAEFLIGRSADCDLQVDHSRVSMEHCRVSHHEGGRVVIEDLHSTYGTFVNDRDVELSALHDGDRIRVGPLVLLCCLGSEASAARRRVLEGYAAREARARLGGASLRDPNEDSPIVTSARQIFDRISSHGHDPDEGDPAAQGGPASAQSSRGGRSRRMEVEDTAGVALVNLLDRAILHDLEIQQIASELEDLIEQGRRRIVIDFGNVRHMSSQGVGILIRSQRRLKALGGLLRVCNPNPEVAEVFKITNLFKAIEIHVDEHAALRAGWPDTAAESPAAQAVASAQAPLPVDPRIQPVAGPRAETPQARVRLVIEVGKARGKEIPIAGPSFHIGRDPRCQLRPASEAISRAHTRIALRDGKVFVRDLGTTNGTLLGESLLHGEEAEAHDGDRLQIGPLAFRFSIDAPTQPETPPGDDLEDAAASWLLQGVDTGHLTDTALRPLPAAEAAIEARRRALDEIRRVKHQIVGDVTVVTVLSADLREEEQIAPVRHELIVLMDQPVPKRVVVRMGRVETLSSLAVAMFLGHFQRLDRLGGGLRLCEVRDDLAAVLDTALLTTPLRIYNTAEQAIREPWPIS